MTQAVPLHYGDVAIEPFFDDVQEVLSGSAPSLRLTVLNNTSVRVLGGSGDQQAGVSIGGYYRFNTANADAVHPGGAAGVYDIYVTGTPNDFSGPPSAIDHTVYAFGVQIVPSGTLPAAALRRKVGELDWDGTNITHIRQLAGSGSTTDPTSPTAPEPHVTPHSVRGIAGQAAPLSTWESVPGTVVATITPTGGASFSGEVVVSSVAGLTLTGAGGHTALELTDGGAGITIGGDTNLYRAAANTLKTDGVLLTQNQIVANYAQASQSQIGGLGPGGQAALALGGGTDTFLYRSASNALRTPGTLTVDGTLTASGALAASGTLTASGGIALPSGQGITWNGDTTLGRASAGVVQAPGLAVGRPGAPADLHVFGAGTVDGGLRADGRLDLTRSGGTTAASGTSLGDKIALFQSGAGGYGFGIQASRLVAYVDPGSAFAVRPASGAGNASSGADAVTLSATGAIGGATLALTGLATVAGVQSSADINTTGVYRVGGAALASTHLSDSAALARLAGPTFTGTTTAANLAVSGNVGFYGTAPAARPAARTVTNWTIGSNAVRALDRNTASALNLFDAFWTLVYDLQQLGLLA